MNEFTKEELEDIYISLDGDDSICFVGEELLTKIQSMIDNHCEHINAVINEQLKCIHCGRLSGIKITKYHGTKVAE